VAGATHHVTREGGAISNDGIRFPSELSVTTSDFALGQVLSFGSLDYVVDHQDDLCPLCGAALVGNVPPMFPHC